MGLGCHVSSSWGNLFPQKSKFGQSEGYLGSDILRAKNPMHDIEADGCQECEAVA